jgi:hypothetical protein
MSKIKGTLVDKYADGRIFANFESVPDLFRTIEAKHWTPQHSKSSDVRNADGEYVMFKSLAEAHHVFLNEPWRVRQFSQKDDRLRLEDNPGNDVFFATTGDYLDVGRYLEGEPEAFGNSIMGNPARVFAEINVNIAAAKWTTAEYMMRKQKRLLRLVDWLETYGIRCHVRCSVVTDVGEFSVTVKDAQDPFDLNHLAVAMHPDFLRRTVLLVFEQSEAWTFGYGDAVAYDDISLESKFADPEDGFSIYVGGYMPYSKTDTPDKYTYENDVSRIDKDFDSIEAEIARLIQNESRFTEEPLKVGRPYLKLNREKIVANSRKAK